MLTSADTMQLNNAAETEGKMEEGREGGRGGGEGGRGGGGSPSGPVRLMQSISVPGPTVQQASAAEIHR